MKQQPSPLWTTGTTEVRLTGTWRSALPVYRTAPSPCLGACPVDGRIAEWVGRIHDGDSYAAWLTLVDNNPFPAIAGRICHHPCESACNRKQLDEAVGICSLERHVGDMALQQGRQFVRPAVERNESVAVVGGGPAGLSAAYQLRRRGYAVHLFESSDGLGGLMRYGIPAYRLDKQVLDGEIQRIVDLGVQVHLRAEVADGEALRRLADEYDGVYLATGASRSKTLPNLDYQQSWVVDGADFLALTNSAKTCELGAALVVIGGGSAAMDVARTARRLGKSVTVLALEPQALLPAQRVEVDEALEEGVEFVFAAMMRSADGDGDRVTLSCSKVNFHPRSATAGFTVEPIAGSEFQLTADTVIPSIGQDADIERWHGLLDGGDTLIHTDGRWRTSVSGIFAGGDVASMDRFVTAAVGMGKQAAWEIARHIEAGAGEPRDAGPGEAEVPFSAVNSHYYPLSPRRKPANAEVAIRLHGFEQVQGSLAAQEAVAESARCFSCGTCIYCDNCYFYCPDMAITKLERGYEVKTDYCKGCGLCVAECPTGSIVMREESQGQGQ